MNEAMIAIMSIKNIFFIKKTIIEENDGGQTSLQG